MQLTFHTTTSTIQQAESVHHDHYWKTPAWLGYAVGIFALVIGIFSVSKSGIQSFGSIYIILGFFWILRKPLSVYRGIDNLTHRKRFPFTTKIKVNADSFSIHTPDSNTTYQWRAFIDLKIVKDSGILVYTHKNIYLWIPSSADVSEGNWDDFVKLIEQKVDTKMQGIG